MKNISPKEAIEVLEDMKIEISLPKAAVTQRKRNAAIEMAIDALKHSELPNSSGSTSRQAAIDAIYEHEFSNWCDKDEVSTILNDLPSVACNCSETPNGSECEDAVSRKAAFEAVFDNPRPTIGVIEYDNELSMPMMEAVRKMGGIKGLFLPGVTVKEFKNGSLEAVEDLISSGEVYDVTLRNMENPKTGKWLCTDDEYEYAICSICRKESEEPYEFTREKYKYCPHCGAKMEG